MISSGSMSHMDPIERAIALAIRASDAHEFPVGAVVHRDGIIIGEGMNQKETLKDPSAHAELLAVRAAATAIGDLAINRGDVGEHPRTVPHVFGGHNLQARIAHVVYLAKDIRWGACGSIMDFSHHSALNHRCTLDYRPNSTVVDLMKQFFKREGKR